MLPLALAAALAAPPVGAAFTFHRERTVGGGAGALSGVSERREVDGRYEVIAVDAATMTVAATYAWRTSGRREDERAGAEDRVVVVDLATRRYLTGIDLDELDRDRPEVMAAWFWISEASAVGDSVAILDQRYTVAAVGEPYGEVASTIRLEGAGERHHEDGRGRFDEAWTETFWFDAATGLYVASAFVGHNEGRAKGKPASFTVEERAGRRAPDFLGLRAEVGPQEGATLPWSALALGGVIGAAVLAIALARAAGGAAGPST